MTFPLRRKTRLFRNPLASDSSAITSSSSRSLCVLRAFISDCGIRCCLGVHMSIQHSAMMLIQIAAFSKAEFQLFCLSFFRFNADNTLPCMRSACGGVRQKVLLLGKSTYRRISLAFFSPTCFNAVWGEGVIGPAPANVTAANSIVSKVPKC